MSAGPADWVNITVRTQYLPEQSDPVDGRFAFAYTIRIQNDGPMSVRLLHRHWIITDGNDQQQEVRGEGVVGEQPGIDPGAHFEYSSGTLIETPVGVMEGSYEMITAEGVPFIAPIPPFNLIHPASLH